MVDRDLFIAWCESQFGRIKLSGNEILLNSIFTDDKNHKLYCNPDKNVYHCFKSGKSGSLHHLVSLHDGIHMQDTYDIIGGKPQIADIESRIIEILKGKKVEEPVKYESKEINLPSDTYRFNEVPYWCKFKNKAMEYLSKRKMDYGDFYFCVKGKYANRIIIPWFNENGDRYYWNARTIMEDVNPKYRLPSEEATDALKSYAIWISDWDAEKIYLTEGEIDAISLAKCGFASAAIAGKELTDGQAELLEGRQIVVALDNDEYGVPFSIKTGKKLIENGFKNIRFVRPPVGFKDWNEFYVSHDEHSVQDYIKQYETDLDILKLELLSIK